MVSSSVAEQHVAPVASEEVEHPQPQSERKEPEQQQQQHDHRQQQQQQQQQDHQQQQQHVQENNIDDHRQHREEKLHPHPPPNLHVHHVGEEAKEESHDALQQEKEALPEESARQENRQYEQQQEQKPSYRQEKHEKQQQPMQEKQQQRLNEAMPEDHPDIDERTLLDTFGEAAKQYLTQRVIPPTDEECKWDWRYVRCEPWCDCDFRGKWGDYHMGRACRIRAEDRRIENCNPLTDAPAVASNAFQLVIQRAIQGTRKAAHTIGQRVKVQYGKVQRRVCDPMPDVICTEQGELPLIAWQERLICRHKIPDCGQVVAAGGDGSARKKKPSFGDMLVHAAEGTGESWT